MKIMIIYLFIFIYSIYIAPLQVTLYSEALPTTARTLCRSFHAETHRAIVSEGLAQGPYVAPRAGFEPTTLRPQANTYPLYHHVGMCVFLYRPLLFRDGFDYGPQVCHSLHAKAPWAVVGE